MNMLKAKPTMEQLIAERDAALSGIDRGIAERDKKLIEIRRNGPHSRNMAHSQRDAGHLPLFIEANEPRMI